MGEHEPHIPTPIALDEPGAPVDRLAPGSVHRTLRHQRQDHRRRRAAGRGAERRRVVFRQRRRPDRHGVWRQSDDQTGASLTDYLLQWIVTGSIQEGRGKLDGNKLRVEWRTVEEIKPSSGVTAYTVTTKRQLYGDRAVNGLPKLGTGSAFPKPERKGR